MVFSLSLKTNKLIGISRLISYIRLEKVASR